MGNTTLKTDDKFSYVKDIIEYYQTDDKPDRWYGDIFEKLMSFSPERLLSVHKVVMKKRNAKK